MGERETLVSRVAVLFKMLTYQQKLQDTKIQKSMLHVKEKSVETIPEKAQTDTPDKCDSIKHYHKF